ncbi:MAG: hypothetical protein QW212_06705 [Nitrososphaerales archaeon]
MPECIPVSKGVKEKLKQISNLSYSATLDALIDMCIENKELCTKYLLKYVK